MLIAAIPGERLFGIKKKSGVVLVRLGFYQELLARGHRLRIDLEAILPRLVYRLLWRHVGTLAAAGADLHTGGISNADFGASGVRESIAFGQIAG